MSFVIVEVIKNIKDVVDNIYKVMLKILDFKVNQGEV